LDYLPSRGATADQHRVRDHGHLRRRSPLDDTAPRNESTGR
jgi:hypothetical protein